MLRSEFLLRVVYNRDLYSSDLVMRQARGIVQGGRVGGEKERKRGIRGNRWLEGCLGWLGEVVGYYERSLNVIPRLK